MLPHNLDLINSHEGYSIQNLRGWGLYEERRPGKFVLNLEGFIQILKHAMKVVDKSDLIQIDVINSKYLLATAKYLN